MESSSLTMGCFAVDVRFFKFLVQMIVEELWHMQQLFVAHCLIIIHLFCKPTDLNLPYAEDVSGFVS